MVKRLRPKNGTIAAENHPDGSAKKPFVVTGSTLRPVTRINIKTKLGGKISTTYRTTEITDGSPSPTASSTASTTTTTTTQEPELVTASEDVVEEKRHHNHPSLRAGSSHGPFSKKSFPVNNFNNNSHLVIKVISEKPLSPTPSYASAPFSIKKPILNGPGKKLLKPGSRKGNTKGDIFDEENQTKSPDYDYAYYNSDDATDYDSETSKIDHKNYGSKPNQRQSK